MNKQIPWLAVLGFAGCAADQSSDQITQIGVDGVRLPIAGERTTAEPPSWDYIDEQLSGLGATGGASLIPLTIDEGVYESIEVVLRDPGCGIDRSDFIPAEHGIRSFRQTGHYVNDYIENGAVFDTRDCEVRDLQYGARPIDIRFPYRCKTSITKLDLRTFNLDATIKITNSDFGTWDDRSPRFLGRQQYAIECSGSDCDKPPASNLFGLITRPMPCVGADGFRFQLDDDDDGGY